MSVDVELTAYVLLALLMKENVTKEEIAFATGIVTWLTKQQNAYGGFASTQVQTLFLPARDQAFLGSSRLGSPQGLELTGIGGRGHELNCWYPQEQNPWH